MKKTFTNFFLWFFLFAIIFLELSKYNTFKIFKYTDIFLIITIFLLFSGMIWTSFIFIFLYSFILDCIFMDFIGINVLSYLATFLFVFYLCQNMDTYKLITKILIIFFSCLLKIIIYSFLIFIFYWNNRFYFINFQPFLKIISTVFWGAIILIIIDFFRSGVTKWQSMKL